MVSTYLVLLTSAPCIWSDSTIQAQEKPAEVCLCPASVHNYFNLERDVVDRETYEIRHSAAVAEWQNLMGELSHRWGVLR